MAISFKSDEGYGFGIAQLFGVSDHLIYKAKAIGVTVEQSSPGNFIVKHDGIVHGSIPVKGSAISLAKSKTLGPASKEALKFQFESALTKAVNSPDWNPLIVPKGSDFLHPTKETNKPGNKPEGPKVADFLCPTKEIKKPGTKPDVVVPKSGISMTMVKPDVVFPKSWSMPMVKPDHVAKFPKDGAVPLCKATKVYEPVVGTTAGSVYYVLAMFDGLNLAARCGPGQKLSLRAEGVNLKEYLPALEDFNMDSKGSYCSGHYQVENLGLMLKSLGALIGRIGYSKSLSVADLETFVGGQ